MKKFVLFCTLYHNNGKPIVIGRRVHKRERLALKKMRAKARLAAQR